MQGQSKLQSILESSANIIIGISINYLANITILPLVFGIKLGPIQYGKLTLIYTIISLVRSYILRRMFNRIQGSEITCEQKTFKV